MIAEIIFWLSVTAIFHTYVLFPFLLKFLAKGKKENLQIYTPEEDLPLVSVILSVHNESGVILKKLTSIYNTLYPLKKIEVLIGSDASTDKTDLICKIYSENYDSFYFFPFTERKGKPEIVNNLVEFSKGEILIMTDAQAYFDRNTIYEIIKHFRNPAIDIVGGNIINEKVSITGISFQETEYMKREIRMKYLEGLVWGQTMGVYGAIFAIRKEAFMKVPENYTVDDFYLTMQVLQKKRKAILNLKAIVREDVPGDLNIEFKRKIRISAGNFQNMNAFRDCLIPPWSSLAFVFFSHKVLRWTGPLFLLLMFLSNIILAYSSVFFRFLIAIQTILVILPFIDIMLRKLNFHSIILRFVTHFYAMNIALSIGFFKNLTGKKTNIWQPTRR